MTKRVIISFDDVVVEKLDEMAVKVGISRNMLVEQICREKLGLPSLLKEAS